MIQNPLITTHIQMKFTRQHGYHSITKRLEWKQMHEAEI